MCNVTRKVISHLDGTVSLDSESVRVSTLAQLFIKCEKKTNSLCRSCVDDQVRDEPVAMENTCRSRILRGMQRHRARNSSEEKCNNSLTILERFSLSVLVKKMKEIKTFFVEFQSSFNSELEWALKRPLVEKSVRSESSLNTLERTFFFAISIHTTTRVEPNSLWEFHVYLNRFAGHRCRSDVLRHSPYPNSGSLSEYLDLLYGKADLLCHMPHCVDIHFRKFP